MSEETTGPIAANGDAGEEPGLAEHLGVLVESRWLIAAALALALAAGISWLLVAPPTFQSDAVIQVEEQKKTLSGLSEISEMFSEKSEAETEIEIIRSRSLLGSVVDQLHLDITARPRVFPIVGGFIARRHDARKGLASPVLGLGRYAWGGERIQVDRLAVPDDLVDKALTLVAGEGGRFALLDPDGRQLAAGEVGTRATGAADGEKVEIFVSELKARPGTRFGVRKRNPEDVVDALAKELSIGEKGKKTGILRVALEGRDPRRLADTVQAIAVAYLRQNVYRKSEDAQKTLEFVNGQLPVVKSNLESAEAALNSYRSRKGSIDLTLEAKGILDRVADVEKALTEVQLQRAELRLRFTEKHPAIRALDRKKEQLEAERDQIAARIKQLPASELDSARLMRDAKVANELYVLLLNKAQELSLVKSGAIGNVRILDPARLPRKPVRPLAGQTLGLAALLGLMLGVALAYGRNALRRGVEDPDLVEQLTGITVYSTVPFSERQRVLARSAEVNEEPLRPLLARFEPTDLAVESLRSLRTSLQFALMDSPSKVVAIAGPSPGIGKSFVAANLAQVLADAGMRVLLVDADMRRGSLHEFFGMERNPGLSDVVSGAVPLETAVSRQVSKGLDFLATGTVPPAPSELLMSIRFQALVASVSKQYDLVLLDTPPVLAVTDAALVGRHCGATLIVLRAGHHPAREISLCVKRMVQNGVRPQGFVFNDVRRHGPGFGAYSYHYHYDYAKKPERPGKIWRRLAALTRKRASKS